MRKIKLPLFTIALCLSLLGFVNGGKAASTFTLTAGADPSALASWKKSPGGTAPANFTSASQTFQIGVTAGAISSAATWVVSGSASKVIIASGGTLSDNATHSLSLSAITVQNGGTLVLANNSFSLGTFIVQAGSTIKFSGTGTQTIPTGTYYNLIIAGTGTINDGGDIVVSTALTINAGCALTLNGAELDLNGTLSGTGTITGDNTAIVTVNSGGNIGTLNLTPGSALLDELQIQSGSVTLGNDLLISGGGSG